MNRSESPSTALRAPSPPLGEKDGMRRYGSWKANSLPNEVRQAAVKAGDSEVEHRVVRDQEMNFLLAAAKLASPMLIKSMVEPASDTHPLAFQTGPDRKGRRPAA